MILFHYRYLFPIIVTPPQTNFKPVLRAMDGGVTIVSG